MSNLAGYLTYFHHATIKKEKVSVSVMHGDDITPTGGFIMIIFFSSRFLYHL